MEQQFSLTMGNILRKIDRLGKLSDDLKTRIKGAKQRRDFLSHRYWRERSIEFASEAGRARMRQELNEDTELFYSLDREVDAAMQPVRARLGIKEEVLAE